MKIVLEGSILLLYYFYIFLQPQDVSTFFSRQISAPGECSGSQSHQWSHCRNLFTANIYIHATCFLCKVQGEKHTLYNKQALSRLGLKITSQYTPNSCFYRTFSRRSRVTVQRTSFGQIRQPPIVNFIASPILHVAPKNFAANIFRQSEIG